MATKEIDQEPETDAVVGAVAALEKKIVLIASLGVILGAFLPWAQIFGQMILGIEGDGLLTLILAGIVILLAYFRWGKKSAAAIAGIGALVTFIAFLSVTGVAAMGVYLTLFGGLVLLGGGVQGFRKF